MKGLADIEPVERRRGLDVGEPTHPERVAQPEEPGDGGHEECELQGTAASVGTARLRPMRSPNFEVMRMKAAEISASRAMAGWPPLAVVCSSATTAEMDTLMGEVSTTRMNIAAASSATPGLVVAAS